MGISITENNFMYVSDMTNNRIVVIDLDSTGNIYTIGSGPGSNRNQLQAPGDLFVTNNSLYIVDIGNRRVQKASLNGWNPSTVPGLTGFDLSYYLYVDERNNIYLSETYHYRVLLFPSNSTNFTIVAGTGVLGNSYSQLNCPYGVFVNDVGTIFIADCYNHRVMKWFSGASAGVIVVGNGTSGLSPSQVS